MFSKKDSTQLSKKELREYFKKQIDDFCKENYQKALNENLLLNISFFLDKFFENKSGYWGVYMPLPDEPQLTKFFLKMESGRKDLKWVYPKITDFNKGLMDFYRSENFVENSFGIKEPQQGELISKNQIQGVLVPGLGFNRSGQRLGRGKGFYDRYLQDFKGEKVGVCFSVQLVDFSFEKDQWDAEMDHIINENEIWNVNLK